MPWLRRLSGQSNLNTSIMRGMSTRPAMPYTHFDYMYLLSAYICINCWKEKGVAVDCCNLEKCFNRSFLKLVSTCSSLILKFDATLFFDE